MSKYADNLPSPGPWRWEEYDEGWELFSADNPCAIMQIYESHGGGWEPNEIDRKRIADVPNMEIEIVLLRQTIEDLNARLFRLLPENER